MAPFRHAMRFVDGEHLRRMAPEPGPIDTLQSLWTHVQELAPSFLDGCHGSMFFGRRAVTVDSVCCHPLSPAAIDLVVHQRDERADDHDRPFPGEGRDLDEKSLSCRCRENSQYVLSFHHRLEHLSLERPYVWISEGLGCSGDGVVTHR